MKDTILIVDDSKPQRDMFSAALRDSFPKIITAANGLEALEQLRIHMERLAMVLLDINMPVMNGIEVLQALHRQDRLTGLPVLIISGEEGSESINTCFQYPIADFIPKKVDIKVIQKRVKNISDLYSLKNHLQETVDSQTRELKEKAQRLAAINNAAIELLGNVIEARDMESGLHVKRVRQYSRLLAEEYMKQHPGCGLTPDTVEQIASASALHDIGKIKIPDSILLKQGRLTDEETEIMKAHSEEGCRLLSKADGLWSEEYAHICRDICRYHHERYDGTGYPLGLKGSEIPLSAQFAALADVFDALVSDRCYRKAYDTKTAYEMITSGKCGSFSPELLKCFESLWDKFEETAKQNK